MFLTLHSLAPVFRRAALAGACALLFAAAAPSFAQTPAPTARPAAPPAAPAAAQPEPDGPPPALILPVACAMGTDCWVQSYFDHDPGARDIDYTCGSATYGAHLGTDFRVADLAAMARGVPVVAAAAGVVAGVRDGVEDISMRDAPVPRGRECGNGVRIVHGGGWETQYCHLRKGSVAVKNGDAVNAGAQLGLIGLSGNTEFPHVHLEVTFRRISVDPFVGKTVPYQCGQSRTPLFTPAAMAQLRYAPASVINGGFSAERPNSIGTMMGKFREPEFGADEEILFFWIEYINARAGDRETARITMPNGQVLPEDNGTVDRNLARRMAFWGKQLTPRRPWPPGTYTGRFELQREIDGKLQTIVTAERTVEVRASSATVAAASAAPSPQPPVQTAPLPVPVITGQLPAPGSSASAAATPPAPQNTLVAEAVPAAPTTDGGAQEPGGRLQALLRERTAAQPTPPNAAVSPPTPTGTAAAVTAAATAAATQALDRARSLFRGDESATPSGRRRRGPDSWMLGLALLGTLAVMALAFLATYRR